MPHAELSAGVRPENLASMPPWTPRRHFPVKVGGGFRWNDEMRVPEFANRPAVPESSPPTPGRGGNRCLAAPMVTCLARLSILGESLPRY